MSCIYKKNLCLLSDTNVMDSWCSNVCGNDSQSKLKMLKRLSIEFDADYDGSDLLEWVKAHGKQKGNNERREENKRRQAEQEAERQRLLSEMPSGFELGPILARHLKEIHRHYKETGRIKNSDEETQRRVEICKECPSRRSVIDDKGSLRCADCSCHIDKGIILLGGKAEYEAITCSRGHWKT